MSKPGRNQAIAAERASIREEVLPFLRAIVRGERLPIRDAAGRVTGESDPPPLELRVSTALSLAKKVMPDLQASQVDLTSGGEGIVQLVLGGIVPPGGGLVIEHQNAEIEGHVTPRGIEDQAAASSFRADQVLDPALVTNPSRAELPPELADNPKVRRRLRRRST